jgi:hypothetical protein
VVASDVYIADIKRHERGNRPVFPTDPPVRATLGGRRLANADALIEAMVMAVK